MCLRIPCTAYTVRVDDKTRRYLTGDSKKKEKIKINNNGNDDKGVRFHGAVYTSVKTSVSLV